MPDPYSCVLCNERVTHPVTTPQLYVRAKPAQSVNRCAGDDETAASSDDEIEYDDVVRAIVTPAGESAGFMVKSVDGTWDQHPVGNAKMVLQSRGYSKPEAERFVGQSISSRWIKVALPFQPEYPGGRQWNLDAPQFKVQPVLLEQDEALYHPSWDLIMQHIGANLDEAVQRTPWCQANGIISGEDWLKLWIAAALRCPFEPTPYLFLHGPENSGKSILHESLARLLTKGVVSADRALTNPNNFNGELAGAVFAVIEEADLSKSTAARNRLKEWVTARTLSIRKMRTDQFSQPNTLHFIQCANRSDYCPVFPGDSRIVVCHVPLPKKPIPKKQLEKRLDEEAPHFLATLLQLPLPEPDGRLRVAVVETDEKLQLGSANAPVYLFIQDECRLNPDAKIAKRDLFRAYEVWCISNGYQALDKSEFGKQLLEFTRGKVKAKGKALDARGERVDAYQGIELLPGELPEATPLTELSGTSTYSLSIENERETQQLAT